MAKTFDDCPHPHFTYSQKMAWSMGYNEARQAGFDESAQFLDEARRELRTPGNLGEYGRGVLNDAAEAIRQLK